MKRVYVAGPYTKGDVAVNVKNGIQAGNRIIAAGHAPFVPHLSHFQHMESPQPYETWMAIDFAWVEACDVLWRIPGDSAGADREVAHAIKLGIPVVYTLPELLEMLT